MVVFKLFLSNLDIGLFRRCAFFAK